MAWGMNLPIAISCPWLMQLLRVATAKRYIANQVMFLAYHPPNSQLPTLNRRPPPRPPSGPVSDWQHVVADNNNRHKHRWQSMKNGNNGRRHAGENQREAASWLTWRSVLILPPPGSDSGSIHYSIVHYLLKNLVAMVLDPAPSTPQLSKPYDITRETCNIITDAPETEVLPDISTLPRPTPRIFVRPDEAPSV
ncbi:hypothetical protein LY76DRAFT_638516 [Colletotrichum caudatum]|nr:hypothetical protein LY76DRAFT_638516 [Colletotrichum caudatum]